MMIMIIIIITIAEKPTHIRLIYLMVWAVRINRFVPFILKQWANTPYCDRDLYKFYNKYVDIQIKSAKRKETEWNRKTDFDARDKAKMRLLCVFF